MFSAKKLLIIGFFVVLLIAIPVTVYLLQQQQELRSRAQAASVLSFDPPSTPSNPLQVQVDDTVDLDVMLDPGTNLVSFVRLEIQYDSTKLATASGAKGAFFEQNTVSFPSLRGDPQYEDGKIILAVSVGPDPTSAVKTKTKIGTIHFKAIEKTDTPTQVIFGTQTQVLSIGSEDQASENVLSSSTPVIINVVGPTETPTPTQEPTPTEEITPTVSPTESANQLPSCTTLTADVTSGEAPLSVNFMASGTDPDGTIEKITFNFGDGNVTSITEGLSQASSSATTSYTYSSGGTFTASAVVTDEKGATSTNTCSQTIVVSGETATPTATLTETPTLTTTITETDTPTPTMESPGPGATIIGLGAFFTVLSIIGAILFFTL